MNKKIFVLLMGVAGFVLNADIKPVYSWDFEKFADKPTEKANIEIFRTSAPKPGRFYMFPVKGQGVENSMAMKCMKNFCHISVLPWKSKDFAIELKFKLTQGLNLRRATALFAYTTKKDFSRRMFLWISHDKRLEGRFQILNDKKKVEKEFVIRTESLNWNNNQYYNLRFSAVSGGRAVIELDGKRLAENDNAMSLIDLQNPDAAENFNILYFGYYPFYGGIGNPLNGYIDDLKIYDKVTSTVKETKTVEVKKKTAVIQHLCLDNQWSNPFTPAEQPGKLLGTFIRAEEKFWKNAARVRANLNEKNIIIEFDCPVPDGMKVSAPVGKLWNRLSDRVEFFIQPDPAKKKYYQYAVSVSGESYCGIGMLQNPESKAKFKVENTSSGYKVYITVPISEFGLTDIADGVCMRGNFMRAGGTSGNGSSLGYTGDNYHAIENFIPLIAGSRKSFFKSKFNNLEKDAAVLKNADVIQKNLSELKSEIEKNGNDPVYFAEIEENFSSLDYSILQCYLDGAKQMMWLPDVWDNNMNLSRLARPLKVLKVYMPRNSRKMVGFAISNLENTPFLGQIKVFNRWPWPRKNWQHFAFQEWNDFLSNIRFHEGIGTYDSSNRMIYDTLSQLPMNTLLRIPSKTTAPVWIEISSHGLKPGKYSGHIVLKNSGGQGGFETAMLEVTVAETDMNEICLDKHIYNSVVRRAWNHASFRDFFRKHELNYLTVIPGNGLYIYWKYDKNKKMIPGKLEMLGQLVEKAKAAGYDLKKLKIHMELGWNHGYGAYPDSPHWEEIMSASIPAWLEYLEKNYGIPHEHVVMVPIDEPNGNIDDSKTSMGRVFRWSKFIKKVAPRAKVMINPYNAVKSNAYQKLAPYCDIFVLYRPEVEGNKKFIEYMQNLKKQGKQIWTYNIIQKNQRPELYRTDYWLNRRDNFNSVATFWDFDDHAGGDGFDPNDVTNPAGRVRRTDYGMAYVDFNYGTLLPSRRFEAAMRGFEEMKVAFICQKRLESLKKKGVDVKNFEARLNTAILNGCNKTMTEMDNQADIILELSEEIIKLDNTTK